MATPMTVDFRNTPDQRQHKSGKVRDVLPTREPPRTAEGKLLTPKQIRARARRKMARSERMTDQEADYLFQKPLDEWDFEELAHGRPRSSDGSFRGRSPKWITAAVHEQAMERYTAAVKSEMNTTTVDALEAIKHILSNEDVDDKGKPIVPAGTKLEAAKFLIEHVVGKPKQRMEADVSVKLQGILGQVMVNPAQALMDPSMGGQGYTMAHYPGITMEMATAVTEDFDESELTDG